MHKEKDRLPYSTGYHIGHLEGKEHEGFDGIISFFS